MLSRQFRIEWAARTSGSTWFARDIRRDTAHSLYARPRDQTEPPDAWDSPKISRQAFCFFLSDDAAISRRPNSMWMEAWHEACSTTCPAGNGTDHKTLKRSLKRAGERIAGPCFWSGAAVRTDAPDNAVYRSSRISTVGSAARYAIAGRYERLRFTAPEDADIVLRHALSGHGRGDTLCGLLTGSGCSSRHRGIGVTNEDHRRGFRPQLR